MTPCFILLLPVFLLTACATASNPAKERPPSALPASEPKMPTVAVLEFEDHGIGRPPGAIGLGRTLSDRISEQLSGRRELRLIDRESLQKILQELSFGSLDITDRESQLRLGKLLGARYLIMGGYTILGETLRIDGRIVEVESGLVEGDSLEGPLSERAFLEKTFSKQLVDQLTARLAVKAGPPVTAQDYFLRGLTLEQSNDPGKALEMYQKALALDPRHPEARERMETLLLKDLQ
ncbi:MAG: CsgG/HfaB family protein [Candidatus Manganitrophaceae bacterium]